MDARVRDKVARMLINPAGVIVVWLLVLASVASLHLTDPGQTQAADLNVDEPLTFGVLPVLQALPVFVADEKGLFRKEGLNVDVLTFRTALETGTALSTGRLHGYFGDLFTPIVLAAGGTRLKIAARNFITRPGERMFAILAGPETGITDLEALSGVPVAVSTNTIIEYITVTLMKKSGLDEDGLEMLEARNIPLRYQMLMTGQVKAAALPEPLVSLAENKGARVLADDAAGGLTSTVLVFSGDALAERRGDVKRFLKVMNSAADLINSDPEGVRPIMNRNCKVPAPLQKIYPVPEFPPLAVPEPGRVEKAADWLASRGAARAKPTYADLVDDRLLD
jgi:NitT/TauT family transport system substrate-binding protein